MTTPATSIEKGLSSPYAARMLIGSSGLFVRPLICIYPVLHYTSEQHSMSRLRSQGCCKEESEEQDGEAVAEEK